ncbi:potassium transporter Kup [Lichenifustis flavocetrariae]|uniref:Probable potassium transport system protein Kup n=1 Tax=Lichenifustis flavocetrariae TaxID=2949735 RepID=A0AA41Z572_9HYPH|nr:KUP/HAK/KT family potassium transporter [Lichenifustis flavocetrariae]MCW6513005.1 KUP/HAK/KT family potassium transporter [Lichenifustis flavocetrariae]
MVGATGVVFGDIATSPLYAFRESFIGVHKLPIDAFHVLGVLSLLVWTLLIVVTLKYVFVTMRADNRGEGGSFALLALIERRLPGARILPWVSGAALLATALFYGDAMITPAISILSAVEGLELVDARMTAGVLPVTLVIVVLLFVVQRRGTEALALWFGPVMLLWLLTIAALGITNVVRAPAVLGALSPWPALRFLAADPTRAFLTLGTVVLAVTGAEALYADMGHFGRRPIASAWLWLALPALLLCYMGQSALVLAEPAAIENPFYRMAPSALLVPLIVLSSVATVIASQSIISGAFSVTQQAIRLGYLPRVTIVQTSASTLGQVYAPAVNALLFITVVGLVIGFGSSAALAAAFGLAVTATMVLTTLLVGVMIFHIWAWNPLWAVPLYGLLLTCDVALFAASSTKFAAGGWLPVLVAAFLAFVFATWRKGRRLVAAQIDQIDLPLDSFLASVTKVTRVRGTAVYLSRAAVGLPPALLHNLKHNKVLHERVLLATIETALTPIVSPAERITIDEAHGGAARVRIRYGFMQTPDVPAALALLPEPPSAGDTTYFLSRQTIVPSAHPGMMQWRESLFSVMVRNSETPMSAFHLPINRVVELGSQIEI